MNFQLARQQMKKQRETGFIRMTRSAWRETGKIVYWHDGSSQFVTRYPDKPATVYDPTQRDLDAYDWEFVREGFSA